MQEFFGKKFINSVGFFGFRGNTPSADGVFGDRAAAERGSAARSPVARRGGRRERAGGISHLPRIAFTPFRYGLVVETRLLFYYVDFFAPSCNLNNIILIMLLCFTVSQGKTSYVNPLRAYGPNSGNGRFLHAAETVSPARGRNKPSP